MYTWVDLPFIKQLNDDEQIVVITREHWLILFLRFASVFGFMLFVLGIGFVLASTTVGKLAIEFYWTVASLLIVFLTIILGIYYHNYYLSMQIITSERIIDIDQKSLFKIEMNDLFLENIEAVNFNQKTMWQLLFNYGNMDVETAGTRNSVDTRGSVFENIPNPRATVETINRLISERNLQARATIVMPTQNITE
jgi:hypothetical protein